MRKPAVFVSILALAFALMPVRGEAAASGSLVKASGPAVYYLLDGKRYVFPNERIFFSWYADFGSVVTVSDAELASYLLGGNVTYRPGGRLVKVTTDPKTYAVEKGGILRWITSEDVARALYGDDWNTQVDDLSDAYFLNYLIGRPVETPADHDRLAQSLVAGIFEDVSARSVPVEPENDVVLVSNPPVIPETGLMRAVKEGEWSDPATWGGKGVPDEGDEVLIPFGITVTYADEEAAPLSYVTVDGRLVIESDANTAFAAKKITVNGSMALGSPDNPVPDSRRAALILTGDSPFGISDDGLHVNGYMDIHGAGRLVPWTTLALPAEAGDTELTLSEEVDWVPGDRILVSTGSDDAEETEMRTLIDLDGASVVLDAPLDFTHRADGNRKAEVAVLDRNVKVVGVGEGQGSRIVVGGRGELRVHGAVLEGLGRRDVPGHHPVHFDAAGTASDSYVRNAVITDSGNGCVVMRQTNGVDVSDTVATDITGPCMAMSDGASDDLTFRHNLVVGVSGDDASAFLFMNPSPVVEGNVAVGASAHGYRYELPENATRSDGHLMRPREMDLGAFSGNAAHANGAHGLSVGDDVAPYSPFSTAVFRGLDAAFNGGYGFDMHGANLVMTGANLVANAVGGSFSAFAADFFDSTVVGFPDAEASDPEADPPSTPDDAPGRFGFIFTDGPVSVNGVTFRNFRPTEEMHAAAFTLLPSNPRVPDPRNGYRDITFEDAQPWFVYPPDAVGDYLAVVRDHDAGETVVSADPFLDFACLEEEGHIMTCRGRFSRLLTVFRDAGADRSASFTRLDTGARFTLYPGDAFDGRYAYMTLAEGEGVGYLIEGPPTRSISLDWTGSTAPVLLRIPVPKEPDVRMDAGAVRVETDPAPGEYAYDAASGHVVVHLMADSTADLTW